MKWKILSTTRSPSINYDGKSRSQVLHETEFEHERLEMVNVVMEELEGQGHTVQGAFPVRQQSGNQTARNRTGRRR